MNKKVKMNCVVELRLKILRITRYLAVTFDKNLLR